MAAQILHFGALALFFEPQLLDFPAGAGGSVSCSFLAGFWEQHQNPRQAASRFCALSQKQAEKMQPSKHVSKMGKEMCARRIFPV